MDIRDYQRLAARTLKPARGRTTDLSDYVMGLAGEAGELANTVKKMLFHGHMWDAGKIKEEAGDVLWYLAAIMEVIGESLDEAASENIEKLKRRYPQGYSNYHSVNRSV